MSERNSESSGINPTRQAVAEFVVRHLGVTPRLSPSEIEMLGNNPHVVAAQAAARQALAITVDLVTAALEEGQGRVAETRKELMSATDRETTDVMAAVEEIRALPETTEVVPNVI